MKTKTDTKAWCFLEPLLRPHPGDFSAWLGFFKDPAYLVRYLQLPPSLRSPLKILMLANPWFSHFVHDHRVYRHNSHDQYLPQFGCYWCHLLNSLERDRRCFGRKRFSKHLPMSNQFKTWLCILAAIRRSFLGPRHYVRPSATHVWQHEGAKAVHQRAAYVSGAAQTWRCANCTLFAWCWCAILRLEITCQIRLAKYFSLPCWYVRRCLQRICVRETKGASQPSPSPLNTSCSHILHMSSTW